mmetsp:Transcript_9707/g.18514  ORF Transcript_9707/g.18514 Transcript_9707/m.18514 type:complete len:514 (+) Transcript_9707:61-1602(+)|eukprot:CAMPEP_0175139050 /NCGR_PEP_ID=MMETSP0087-20121206/10682_1 /TAXON_ID=136419 /ORGANISM="Unknown Unknown, Strain D1" /LENGTH=513 /DNA_ID=CAMNT_0016422007 /DNA_START=56 /DNA_END=1594 /DNA_ORIENTATION=+
MSSSVRIGPYTLGRTLGIGSFCKVKLAVHELTGQKVAVKILNRKKLKKMDMGAKVRTEIEIVRMFMHPHIIRLYEVIDTATDIFTVMEFVPGGELFDYIVSRGRLEESEARRMFQEIISGVEYCHSHMVVHRDLKPENLLLDADNHIKLADFGLSSVMKDGNFLKTSCGSPNYAAPEVISGSMYAGPEVDVWSCGVILYAILCGSLPFDDENIRNLFRKIKGGVYSIPSYVSPHARDLVTKMLLVEPVKRITIAEIRAHPWFQENLPPYLALSTEQQIVRTQLIDESILKKVLQMGFSREKVLQALSMGSELLTSRKMAARVNLRQMAVLYNLLLDQKRRKEQDLMTMKEKLVGNANEQKRSEPAQNLKLNPPPKPRLSRVSPDGGRWYVGREFKGDPYTIMAHLYKGLKKLNFEWKVLTVFKVKCRYPIGLVDQAGRRVATSEVLKISIHLYKTPRNQFIIDVQKTYGQTFLFMHLCGKLLHWLMSVMAPRVSSTAANAEPAGAQAQPAIRM